MDGSGGAGRRRLERGGGACGRVVEGNRPLAKFSAAGGLAACLVRRYLAGELRGGVGGGGGVAGAETVANLAAAAPAAVRSSGRAESQYSKSMGYRELAKKTSTSGSSTVNQIYSYP